ncbi:hypothetical protein [Streptomyces sp. NBC_00576]|uniref:hypothetical protein n=1 Tax=Streptomyces sp. NBC_00576 TaxID=2903665 RepID=UPI002E8057DC|nr:hypothetical protein [Streptomyces sp. NBC_00576]WUB69867.1 hypothetical protein OG734_07175 [Streptomyces sp. NBC_00576]
MSDNAPRKQLDPTSDFDIEASPQRTDADLWEAFHAAQGTGSPTDAGSAPMTDEALPPGDEHLDPRPLRQQFKKPQESDGQRPTDPTSAFGSAPVMSSVGATDGMSNHQLPPGDGLVDQTPLRIRFQEGES